MSNPDEQGYFRCSSAVTEEPMAIESYPFTSTGYSSGSESDEAEATTKSSLDSNQVADHLLENQQRMYIYNKKHEVLYLFINID